MVDLLRTLPLAAGVTFGLGWPLVARLKIDAPTKLVAGAVCSLLAVWLLGWLVYVFALPAALFWILPAGATAGLAAGRRELAETLRDARARSLLLGQTLTTAWCLGWLVLVVSYSGGGWTGDWVEHWCRTRFFLEHWQQDHLFLNVYALPARPPLANVVTGALLSLCGGSFACYQILCLVLGSLAFLPAAALAQRWGGIAGSAVLAALVMLNPSFVQNATFAWTKLPAAFFVLAAPCFLPRRGTPLSPAGAALFAAALAGGILVHYSAAPYALALTALACLLAWPHRRTPAVRRAVAVATVIAAALLLSWFGWSLATYGARGTFLSNSSVTAAAPGARLQLLNVVLNLRDTVVPPFLRHPDLSLFAQRSPLGLWHDKFFVLYQCNLPFVFGSTAWFGILACLGRAARGRAERWRWAAGLAALVTLCVAVHGARDEWGLAHVTLQPLVLCGLALLASRWRELGRRLRSLLVAGASLDFALGIAFHFAVQNHAPVRWLGEHLADYGRIAIANLEAKRFYHLAFACDSDPIPLALVLALLAAILFLALAQAGAALRQDRPSSCPPPPF